MTPFPAVAVSIDPGVACTAWALWWLPTGAMVRCGLSVWDGGVKHLDAAANAHARAVYSSLNETYGQLTVCYVEQMMLSPGRDRAHPIAKGNDLLAVQAIGAYVAGRIGVQLRYLTPLAWKGTADKTVTKNRLFGVGQYPGILTASEVQIVQDAVRGVRHSLHHNLHDALGIGACGTGRYQVRAA